MKNTNCEEILIQKSALLDGEKADLSAEQINAHLETCANCRREIAQMESTIIMLGRQARRAPDADLWSAVERRIGAEPKAISAVKWQPFVLVGAFLVAYKLLEMIPERDFGWTLKIVPLVFAVALFGLIKENPFKINTGLILEK
jgi:predicted anti-sigma-YlaC factor YlaD